MPDIAASDVSYTTQHRGTTADARSQTVSEVSFGDGVLTYPAGGVPILRGNLGAPTLVEALSIVDGANANGFVYKYDKANETLRIYEEADASGELVELVGGAATPALATLVLDVRGY